jgi:hypothetical protein
VSQRKECDKNAVLASSHIIAMVWIPPPIHMSKFNCRVVVLRRMTFRRWLSHEGWIDGFMKEMQGGCLSFLSFLLLLCETQQQGTVTEANNSPH